MIYNLFSICYILSKKRGGENSVINCKESCILGTKTGRRF